jgi:hypothetical protein
LAAALGNAAGEKTDCRCLGTGNTANWVKSAAGAFTVAATAAPVHEPSELESVIAAQARDHAAAITSLAARYRLPAVYPYRIFAELGGLLAYGNDRLDSYRRAAGYADRILKGEKPAELPVQFPVKFELVVNLKAGKALGLDLPRARTSMRSMAVPEATPGAAPPRISAAGKRL